MRDEARKNNPLVSTMLILLIVLSPLEHVIGVEKLLYTVGLLVAGLCVLYRKKIVIDETSALLLFLGYAFLTCYWSVNAAPFLNLFNTAVMYIFLFLVLQFSYSEQDYERLKKAFVIQGVVLLILCFTFGTYQDNRFWIISSTTGADPNYLSGWFILPVAMVSEFLLRKNNIFIKALLLVEMVLSFYFVAQSGSRSGLLCIAFVVLVYTTWMLRSEIRRKPLYGIVGIVGFVFLLSVAVKMIPANTLYRFTGASDAGSLGGRTRIWGNLMNALFSHPLGLICGMGQGAAPSYSGFDRVAHNTFMDILFENGMIGLLFYLYFFIVALKRAFKKDIAMGIALVATGVLIFTLSSTYMRFLIFILFMADCHIYQEEQKA